eukprot:Awhi_evm1s9045
MGRGKGAQMRAAASNSQNPANQTPKQLKMQAQQMRKMTPNNIRKRFPEMKNATDEDIENSILQLERMAENPNADPSEFARNPDDMSAEDLSRAVRMQRDMMRKNPTQFWKQMENNSQMQ